ncbi:MAG: phosphate/phosphite/phosphonate ABC transporter substrate-binding protein [Bacteroidales bacterium]|nr:phosphate/phosphite/phosphonate ABC transporter substrate-binding protein [Bacteroidales bacterium]
MINLVIKLKLSLIILIISCHLIYSQKQIVLAVHPYLPYSELQKRFQPLADYLSKQINKKVVVRVGKTYEEHSEIIGKDEVDFAYVGSAEYVRLVEKYGSKPLLAIIENNNKTTFTGKFIARIDNHKINKIQDIDVGKMAFVQKKSTMGYILPVYMFLKNNMLKENFKPAFLRNHNNVALGVLTGDFETGVVKEEIFYEYEKKGLKIIAKTPEIPEHIFIASSKMQTKTVKEIKYALLNLNNTVEGKKILRKIKISITGLRIVEDSYYNNLRLIIKELEKNNLL